VEEDPLATLREMVPYIAHVHLKGIRQLAPSEKAERELQSVSGRRFTGTLLEVGDIAIEPIIAELRRIEYNGYLLIEYKGTNDPRSVMKHSIAHLCELIKSARACKADGDP
jgi:sugar phosphate isomerase/epimerase